MRMIDLNRIIIGCGSILLITAILSCGGHNGSQGQERHGIGIDDESALDQPVMVFDTLIHDFGTIIEGEQVVCYFEYRNDGNSELLITSVKATCGCTTPNWSREPLGPGEKRNLEIIFDASGRSGLQRKVVTVNSNATNPMVKLAIRANVNNSV